MLPNSLKAHLVLMAAAIIWGCTFLIVKSALADASPLVFNAVRMTLAALVLGGIFFRPLRSVPIGALRAGFLIGTLMWLGYELQTVGLLYTSASKSAFLSGICVVLVPLLLAVFWRRHISRYSLAGAFAALAGLYLLCVPSSQGLSLASLNRGDLITLGCAVAFSLQIIVVGRSTQHYSFAHLVPVQVDVCALWMLLSIPIAERHGFLRLTPSVLAALAFTALFGTVACFTLATWAQRFTPPTHVALIYSLEPVFAAVLSYRFVGERLGSRGILGGALILAGVLISELLSQLHKPEEEQELAQEVS